jgi:glycosyltransferase involved in cell wall biosynthesis
MAISNLTLYQKGILMSIRVVMITDFPANVDKVDGGVQAVASYLVSELAKMPELDLHILSLERSRRPYRVAQKPGYWHHQISFQRLGSLAGFYRDQRNIDRCLEEIRPDLVHGQEASPHGILARRSKYPSVVTLHGIKSEEVKYISRFVPRARARLQQRLGDYYCIHRGVHTILISPYVSDYYGDALTGRRYMIPNPVAPSFFDVNRQEEEGRILFAGRITPRKGIIELARAMSRIESRKNVKLVLAGSTEDREYVNEVKDEVSAHKMSDNVDFLGILNSEQMLNELSRCACLVLPSYQETAPMVVQEAMAAGVPVIATHVCGIPYQIDNNATGLLFPPGDVQTLVDKLNMVLSDVALGKKLGRAAKEKAEREYRASKVAQATVDVYKKVLELA